MRFNGDAYSKLFPKHDKPEKKIESVVEDNDDSEDDVIEDNDGIEDNDVSEDEPNDLVD